MYVYDKETGELYSTNELMHYGVPGMKWGKRKIRESREKSIRNTERLRSKDKIDRDYAVNEMKIKYGNNPKKIKKMNRKINNIEKRYQHNDAINKYNIAMTKAKLDKNYKNTSEYKKIKVEGQKELGKEFVKQLLISMV